jgi:hypothetical protein
MLPALLIAAWMNCKIITMHHHMAIASTSMATHKHMLQRGCLYERSDHETPDTITSANKHSKPSTA